MRRSIGEPPAAVSRSAPRRASAYPAERVADLTVLALGLGLAVTGGAVLVVAAVAAQDAGRVIAAIAVYAVALPAMFLGALLFAAAFDTAWRGLFRRLDHAAICLLIAATATPFVVAPAAGSGLGFAAAIWAAAAIGVFVKLRFPIGRAFRSAVVFGLSGWALTLALAPRLASRQTLLLILLGGAFYTIGIGFHLRRRLRYHRAIWHAFVVAGAAAHYLAVASILGWRGMP